MHNLSDNFEGDGIECIKTLNYYNFFLETDAKKVEKIATKKIIFCIEWAAVGIVIKDVWPWSSIKLALDAN